MQIFVWAHAKAKFKMQYFCTCLIDDITSLQIINDLSNYVNKEAFSLYFNLQY